MAVERWRSLVFIESDQAPHDPCQQNSSLNIRSANWMPERNYCHARNGITHFSQSQKILAQQTIN